jgi:hypothetical protein
MADNEITLMKTFGIVVDQLFDGKVILHTYMPQIWSIVNQLSGNDLPTNIIKYRVFGCKAIVEVLQFGDDDFMARYKVVDKQLKELVTVDWVRGNKKIVQSAYVQYQGLAAIYEN